ncbi:PAS domain-containing protein [Thalassobaculum litoreum]|uniref:PAS domain-containing protein n=1 Tax=Thalassobaculum litoreum DSM 18839 TaxID=1123362 RepID=A0A8G2BLJ6_9PROT|nr:PAS domain-containing protein [Thalassobaculum litoreum]SDF96410.1 PAS domain-containing protein [Thalassobaculum litoreum DSM 18839]
MPEPILPFQEAAIAETPHPQDADLSRVPALWPGPISAEDLGDDDIGQFGRYWLSLADAAGGVPDRSDFDPTRIPALLAYLIVLEHLGGDEFRYRLLGTGVDIFTRRSYTGLKTSEIDGHGPGNRIHTLYMETLRQGCMIGCALPYVGRSSICKSVRQIAVPFRTAQGDGQVISLIEFDLISGIETKRLPQARRWVL